MTQARQQTNISEFVEGLKTQLNNHKSINYQISLGLFQKFRLNRESNQTQTHPRQVNTQSTPHTDTKLKQ